MNELLAWGAPFAVAAFCVGLAFAALQIADSQDEFWIAHGLFVFAGLAIIGRITLWAFTTSRQIPVRLVVAVVVGGSTFWLAIEAVRYVNRRHNRWIVAQQPFLPTPPMPVEAPLKPESKPENETRPNLVDRGIKVSCAHQDIWSQVLVEGASDRRYSMFDPDWTVLTIEICNEFQVVPKTIGVDDVTAEIRYAFPNDSGFKLNRGVWLGGRNRIALAVNDSGYLIIALSQISHSPQVRIFTREYPWQEHIHLDSIMSDLSYGQDYPVEVKLISESRGEQYATFSYMLAIDEEGSVEFVKTSDWEVFKQQRVEGYDNA